MNACGGDSQVPDTDCADQATVAEQLDQVAWPVIVGTVAEWDGATASLIVNEVWRGFDLPDKVEIVAEPGRAYTIDAQYIVFPSNREPPFVDTPCSATTRFTAAIAELRPARTRIVVPTGIEDTDLPWEWVIAALVAGAVVAVSRRVIDRRRRPAAVWNPDHELGD